jgi:CheY-like chemotaxis protein
MSDDPVVMSGPGTDTRVDLGGLLQAQKTELVSQLASAVANQFNNVMMAVTSYAELELKKAQPAQKRNLEQILNHASRATSLIQKLLAFSRKQPLAPHRLLLNPVVEAISQLLQPLAGEGINVAVELDPAVGAIVADPVEIEQLVLCLGLNARDAMSGGGQLAVATQLVQLEPESFGTNEPAADGSYVLLSVQYASNHTNGSNGSPSGTQEARMTQAIAAVRGIVKERRGFLRVSSRPGLGTTFRIYFPALGAEIIQPSQPVSTSVATWTKTILIVEDDVAVRNSAAEFLKMEGFKVLQASNGPEALQIVSETRSHVDLLVTDIVMSGMNGNEVAVELLKAHPRLRILYMSGDADRAAKAQSGSAEGVRAVLQKPFRLNKLNDKVRELLNR